MRAVLTCALSLIFIPVHAEQIITLETETVRAIVNWMLKKPFAKEIS